MNRIRATAMLLILMMAAGCQTGAAKKVYYVMFEKTPKLFATQVYAWEKLSETSLPRKPEPIMCTG